ncbi:hypothetical protein FOCC_FOCC013972 [Frankliniella occidentalis]|nr:hypothetical protein FOCC_FOCC013972 [Frankliniella occidentalis]
MDYNFGTVLNAFATLKESLSVSDCSNERQGKIKCFLEQIALQPVSVGDFKVGLEWFNCREPLSFTRHLKGKIVVLDFFTYCCINCLHILPHLRQLERRFSVEDGVVIIGVHSAKFDNEKDSGNISAALKRYDISHPPLFQLVGEFEENELFELITVAVDYFGLRGDLSPHHLPPATATSIIKGPLLFPGKVASVVQDNGSEIIAIANSGLHTVIIASAEGIVKVIINQLSPRIYVIGCPGEPGFVDGNFKVTRFNSPQGLAFSSCDLLYVADTDNHAIRKASCFVDLKRQCVLTIAGNGLQASDSVGGSSGAAQSLSSPWDICFIQRKVLATPKHPQPFLCICPPAPPGYKGQEKLTDTDTSQPPPPPPTPVFSPPPPPPLLPASLVLPPPPPLPLLPLSSSTLNSAFQPPPLPVTFSASENRTEDQFVNQEILAIAMAGSHQIWMYFFQDALWWGKEFFSAGTCTNVAGSGNEANRNNAYPRSASFAQPSGLSYCSNSDELFIADSESSSVRSINLKTGKVSAVVGGSKTPDDLFSFGDVDGVGYDAKLQHPLGVTWHEKSESLFVADSYNHKIKKIKLGAMTCCSYLGNGHTGDLALFNEPGGLCVSADGSKLYVADTNNHCVKVISLHTSSVAELKLQSDEQPPESPLLSSVVIPLRVKFSGRIILYTGIILPEGIKLTEGAPQRWKLQLPDKNWKTEFLSGTFDQSISQTLCISAPTLPYSGEPNDISLSSNSDASEEVKCEAMFTV